MKTIRSIDHSSGSFFQLHTNQTVSIRYSAAGALITLLEPRTESDSPTFLCVSGIFRFECDPWGMEGSL